jgi:hypothetical protein
MDFGVTNWIFQKKVRINQSMDGLQSKLPHLDFGSVGQHLCGREELDDVVANEEEAIHLPPPHRLLPRLRRLQLVAALKHRRCDK